MLSQEYELVNKVQNTHWWWRARAYLMQKIIKKFIDLSTKLEIADVGCGFGANISLLRQFGEVTGLEMNPDAIEKIKLKWGHSVKTIKWHSPKPLNSRFDLMVLADVLEHIPDDEEAVNWIYTHLKKNGYALVTVPAHQYLWTQMDDVLHHHRRYDRKMLTALFDGKFEIVFCSYYNLFLFPVKLLFVLFDKARSTCFPRAKKKSFNDVRLGPLNFIFKLVLILESSLVQHSSIPYGVSLICLVKKLK
jgi:SAM-dependent methyltransferase